MKAGSLGQRKRRARKTLARHCARFALAFAAIALLTGCSSGADTSDPTVAPTVVAVPTPQPTPALSLGPVVWTTALNADGAPDAPSTAISRGVDTIYAVVEAQGVQPETSFTAAWSIDGQPVNVPAEPVRADEGAGTAWVSFALTWNGAALWPVGQLGVTISTGTGESATGTVQIVSSQG